MAYTIGICDDNNQQVQIIKEYILSSKDSHKYKLVESTDAEHFLLKADEFKPDIVFLDIDMGDTNGLEIGKKLRDKYKDMIIIFITAYKQYALDAFEVRAFHYLLKPITKSQLLEVLEEAKASVKKSKNKEYRTFNVNTKKGVLCIPIESICFFEKVKRQIKVKTVEEEVFYYDNFSNLIKEIDDKDFVRCHQGYIVNRSKIKSYEDRTLYLSDLTKLPVSKSYVGQVRKALTMKLLGL